MKKPFRHMIFLALVLGASVAAAETSPPCKTDGYRPSMYKIFVDEPTGYAFVKTPCGWHFVHEIERAKIPEALRMASMNPDDPDGLHSFAADPSSSRREDQASLR